MPGKQKQVKVVLCAALTADGKLTPPVRQERTHDPDRHPWGALCEAAAGILVDGAATGESFLPPTATRKVVVIQLEQSAEAAEARRELAATLDRLRREGVAGDLLCFGGAELFRALLDAGVVDGLRIIVRPQIDGRRGAAALSGAGSDFFAASIACRLLRMETVGDECLLHYKILRPAKKRNRAP